MPDAWKQWIGQVVHQQFPLHQYLGGSEHSAVFLTDRREGEGVVPAAIKLFQSIPASPAIPDVDERRLSGWQLAAGLSHPHLIRVLDMGRCELGGTPLLYVVMEFAEENLARVLSGRPLTPEEAQATLEPVLDALAYLHGKGIVHGHLKPANIMAHDDRLVLSSDGLRRAGEESEILSSSDAYAAPENARRVIPVAEPISTAADVWSLGMTLAEVLTQKLPVLQAGEQGTAGLPEDLPQPFLDIVGRALVWAPQGRWTVDEIATRLRKQRAAAAKSSGLQQGPRAQAQSQTGGERRRHPVPLVIGFLLLATLAGAMLLRRHSNQPQDAPAALKQANPAPDPQVTTPTPQVAPPVLKSERNVGGRETANIQQPTVSAAPASPSQENSKERLPASSGTLVNGQVVQQVLPDIPQSARATIRGTVKISVRVEVGPAGRVESAELESPGPSKYFADKALQASRLWQFAEPIKRWSERTQQMDSAICVYTFRGHGCPEARGPVVTDMLPWRTV